MGRDNVHPFPCGLQSKLLGWSADCRTPPPPGLNALASYRPSACCRRGSAGPSVGSETMGFIVDGIRPGRTPVRTEILKPVTNQVTTPPGSVRRSAMRSDTVLSPICGNPAQPDGIRRNRPGRSCSSGSTGRPVGLPGSSWRCRTPRRSEPGVTRWSQTRRRSCRVLAEITRASQVTPSYQR